MVLEEMLECINILLKNRNISELKRSLNEVNPVDIARLLEEIEDERQIGRAHV